MEDFNEDADRPSFGGLGFGQKRRKKMWEDYGSSDDDESEEKPVKTKEMKFTAASTTLTQDMDTPMPSAPSNNNNNRQSHASSSTTKQTAKKWSDGRDALKKQPEFEKFTKGFGSKMLERMGWRAGEGLGKEGTGINRPIEVKLRPKNAGLGFSGSERTKQQIEDFPNEEDVKDMEEEKVKAETKQPREKGWKKQGKVKKKYVLPEFNNNAGSPSTSAQQQPTKMVITDMTGEQPRVLSSLSEVGRASTGFTAVDQPDYLPELQHNIRLLADMQEAEILNVDKKKRAELINIEKLSTEMSRLEVIVNREADRIQRLKEIMEIVNSCNQKAKSKEISLTSIAKVFLLFQSKYPEEYSQHSLHLLASSLALPLLREELEQWKPLEDPVFAVDQFKTWRELMYDDRIEHSIIMDHQPPDVYTQLCTDLLLPKIRTVLTSQWNIRQPTVAVSLIETWQNVLPRAVLENILEQLILPRLTHEIETWNPRTDTVPIHVWLHPWLPLLGDRLEAFYPSIRHKLAVVLQHWNALDPSAHVMVFPWRNIFEKSSMNALLDRTIIPKLGQALHDMNINPRSQSLEAFNAVLLWTDVLSAEQLADIFSAEFFPKWQQTLYTWLTTTPDFEQISRWYLGWRQLFSDELISQDKIRAGLYYGLTIINNALDGK